MEPANVPATGFEPGRRWTSGSLVSAPPVTG